jgi:hypothetical protein
MASKGGVAWLAQAVLHDSDVVAGRRSELHFQLGLHNVVTNVLFLLFLLLLFFYWEEANGMLWQNKSGLGGKENRRRYADFH